MKQMETNCKTFKDLSIEDLVHGYLWNEQERIYTCIFCGEVFEEGVIYTHGSQLVMAEKASEYHVIEEHGGSFNALLSLDKQISGISESQKTFMTYLYEKRDNKSICEGMGIRSSTVRTHKFNLQKIKRQAKIFLALMKTIESDEFEVQKKKKIEKTQLEIKIEKNEKTEKSGNTAKAGDKDKIKKLFSLNSLYPFFTQYRLK